MGPIGMHHSLSFLVQDQLILLFFDSWIKWKYIDCSWVNADMATREQERRKFVVFEITRIFEISSSLALITEGDDCGICLWS